MIAVPPGGGGGGLVPKSLIAAVESGQLAMSDVPPSGWGPRPVTFTARGKAEADAFQMWSPAGQPAPALPADEHHLRLGVRRRGEPHHARARPHRHQLRPLQLRARHSHEHDRSTRPNITPSYAGHSIGRWEGDVLVVDTVGFEPGVIAPPVRNSDQLHIVERFSLDPEKWVLTREFVAEDPVYFTDQYIGSDQVLVADVPYVAHPCNELAPEFLAARRWARTRHRARMR